MRNSGRGQQTTPTIAAAVVFVLVLAAIFLIDRVNLGGLLSPSSGSNPAAGSAPLSGQSGLFDFYILVLSWSPDYCATTGSNDAQQCSIGRKLGFVLHGVWPQYNVGYPSNCSTTRLPADVKAKFPDLYPSPALYDHEWQKHGTCTGLTPEQYLALSKRFKESVAIPERYRAPAQPLRVTTTELKRDVTAENAWLHSGALAVMCSGAGRYLQELYVCLFQDGKPATCSSEIQRDAARSCARADLLVRNVR